MTKVPLKSKQKQRELTDEELKRLANYMDVLIEMDMKQKSLYRRLKQEPKGFSMPGDSRNCGLCARHVWEESGWFDKWGFKCLNCQDAVNKRKIPGSLCGDYDHKKSISDSDLAMKLGVRVTIIRKYIREAKIKGRRIPNGPFMILRKDNPNLSTILQELLGGSGI